MRSRYAEGARERAWRLFRSLLTPEQIMTLDMPDQPCGEYGTVGTYVEVTGSEGGTYQIFIDPYVRPDRQPLPDPDPDWSPARDCGPGPTYDRVVGNIQRMDDNYWGGEDEFCAVPGSHVFAPAGDQYAAQLLYIMFHEDALLRGDHLEEYMHQSATEFARFGFD